ncbi:MAG: glycosyltransferase family 39 protein, partial [Anaerolineae bacterium]|nr:glycosyltransferase family 39 protein [Anaerolineae bacterium]
FGLRFPWVLVGTATILIVFFLVKRLMGIRLAWATAVILAFYHYHLHYSRLGSNQIADPFFLSLALLFLYRALDRKNNLDWALTGVVTSLALYFYAGARLTPVIIIVVLAYLFIRQPRQFFPQYGRGMLIAAGAFLLVGAPMIQYAYLFTADFNARVNEVGIFQSGWFANEMVIQGSGPVPILLEQFRRAVLAFNFYPDRTVWYGLPQPLLSPFWGVLFWVGMGYGMIRLFGRRSNPRYAPMVAWWWGGMLLGGFLTESPPSSQRLITLAVPVSFFLAVAMWQIIRLVLGVVAHGKYPRWLADGLLAGAVILFSVTSLRLYFVEYTPQRIYGGPNAELATTIAPRLLPLRTSHEMIFVGAPHMYWGFATLPYLVPDAFAQDIFDPLDEPGDVEVIAIAPGKGAVFIFHEQRVPEAEFVKAVYPGGIYEEFFSPVNGRFMASLYVLPPGFQE